MHKARADGQAGGLRRTVEKDDWSVARGLELKVVHSPRYRPGTLLCSLELKDKFKLVVRITPETSGTSVPLRRAWVILRCKTSDSRCSVNFGRRFRANVGFLSEGKSNGQVMA